MVQFLAQTRGSVVETVASSSSIKIQWCAHKRTSTQHTSLHKSTEPRYSYLSLHFLGCRRCPYNDRSLESWINGGVWISTGDRSMDSRGHPHHESTGKHRYLLRHTNRFLRLSTQCKSGIHSITIAIKGALAPSDQQSHGIKNLINGVVQYLRLTPQTLMSHMLVSL